MSDPVSQIFALAQPTERNIHTFKVYNTDYTVCHFEEVNKHHSSQAAGKLATQRH